MRGSDQKAKKVRNELTDEQKNEIRDAFETFSKTGLDPGELKVGLKTLGFDKKLPDIERIVSLINKKGESPINFDEYMDIMVQKPGAPQEEMQKAFKYLCAGEGDKITLSSLKKVCDELGENITEEELKEMMDTYIKKLES